jgi:hypothetical protein
VPPKLTQRLRLDKRTLNFVGFFPTGDFGPFTAYTTRTGKKVIFARSPPLNPPTAEQEAQRQKFTDAGAAWHDLSPLEKANWKAIAHKGALAITGYNLFVWWFLGGDASRIRTIERQTGITVLP